MGARRVGDLEVGQDLAFERRSWAVQRAAWAAICLVLLAALLGLLGGAGPLARARASAGPLEVEYSRFARHGAPAELVIRLGREAARGGEARVWIEQAYLDGLRVATITPPPARVEAGDGRQTFIFALAEGDAPATIVFHTTPQTLGGRAGRLGLPGGPELSLGQLVYP